LGTTAAGLALFGAEAGAAGRAAGSGLLDDPPVPPADPDFALRTWARLNGDLTGRLTYSFRGGMVYGFLPQADDVTLGDFGRRLYGYRSGTVRRSRLASDGRIHVRSRSWFFYTDAQTGRYLHELTNPYTGERVRCPPRALPPYDQILTRDGPRATTAGEFPPQSSDDDRPLQLEYAVMGGNVWIRHHVFSRFHPPDTTWYKLEADIVTCVARLDDVLDGALRHIPNTMSHNLVAEWQTWMNMHGAPGHILFVGNGMTVFRSTQLPKDFRDNVATEFPGTLEEPLKWT
jgi:hypothetical protein